MWAKTKNPGFTIVELLIVIVVIAILAAITIVAYNGIQSRSHDTVVRSDLANFAKRLEIAKAEAGTYPATLTDDMGLKFSKGSYGADNQSRNARYCYNNANDSYIFMVNSKSGNFFKSINGVIEQTPYAHGYSICIQIGLTNINPSQDGYLSTRNPAWASWTN